MAKATLSIAQSLAATWISFYTSGAPGIEREARRDEVLSDLHDHVETERAEGRNPAGIAAYVVHNSQALGPGCGAARHDELDIHVR